MQIPDGDGALALHVMPRYMLHNNLQAGVQYKQQARPSCWDTYLFAKICTSHPMHQRHFCLHPATHTMCVQSTEF